MDDGGDGDNDSDNADDNNDDVGMGWVSALFWKPDFRPF